MKITNEVSLKNFGFWSGAVENANRLTDDQLTEIEDHLEEVLEEPSETDINDLFWFDFDWVLELIGLKECEECGEIIDIDDTCTCEEEE